VDAVAEGHREWPVRRGRRSRLHGRVLAACGARQQGGLPRPALERATVELARRKPACGSRSRRSGIRLPPCPGRWRTQPQPRRRPAAGRAALAVAAQRRLIDTRSSNLAQAAVRWAAPWSHKGAKLLVGEFPTEIIRLTRSVVVLAYPSAIDLSTSHLRCGDACTRIAASFGRGVATVYRYIREAVGLRRPARRRARHQGGPHPRHHRRPGRDRHGLLRRTRATRAPAAPCECPSAANTATSPAVSSPSMCSRAPPRRRRTGHGHPEADVSCANCSAAAGISCF
jgi:hypothetical protein